MDSLSTSEISPILVAKGVNCVAVDDKTKTRVLVNFPRELLAEVDDYWHERRLPNRNEGIRQLIQKGLDKEKAER